MLNYVWSLWFLLVSATQRTDPLLALRPVVRRVRRTVSRRRQLSNLFSLLSPPPGETLLSPLVMCGPHGLKFLKPVELRLPHCASMTPDGWSFALKSSDSSSGTLSSLCPLGLWVLSLIEPGLMALPTLIVSQLPSIPLAL